MENLEEIWKDIPNYEGLYQASNLGRIRSLDRFVKHNKGGLQLKKGRILKGCKTGFERKYRLVTLCSRKNDKKSALVHRLVWSAFNGPIPEGYEINHIDENPSNNLLSNLELVTPKENVNWGTRNERAKQNLTNGKLSISINQYTKEEIYIATFPSSMDIQRKFGYAHSHISACCLGKRKTAYGYKWQYAVTN